MSTVVLPLDVSLPFGTRYPSNPVNQWLDFFESELPVSPPMDSEHSSVSYNLNVNVPSPPSSIGSSAGPIHFNLDQELKLKQQRARRDSRLMDRIRHHNTLPSNDGDHTPLSRSTLPVPLYARGPSPMSALINTTESTQSPHSYIPAYASHTTHTTETPVSDGSYSPSYHHGPPSYASSNEYGYTVRAEYHDYRQGGAPPTAPPPASLLYSPRPSIPDNSPRPTLMGNGAAMPMRSSSESSASRVIQGRSKPRCWEHGCNGRAFSTFSNLLRHQREKSGQASKATCPNCGAVFTRTTARNGHLQFDKCKKR